LTATEEDHLGRLGASEWTEEEAVTMSIKPVGQEVSLLISEEGHLCRLYGDSTGGQWLRLMDTAPPSPRCPTRAEDDLCVQKNHSSAKRPDVTPVAPLMEGLTLPLLIRAANFGAPLPISLVTSQPPALRSPLGSTLVPWVSFQYKQPGRVTGQPGSPSRSPWLIY
jgi:hypothetical protein